MRKRVVMTCLVTKTFHINEETEQDVINKINNSLAEWHNIDLFETIRPDKIINIQDIKIKEVEKGF
jgi:hypothetical protein